MVLDLMDNCIFCKIINGEAPANFVYKGENLVAFKDINPKAPVHILIAPKEHFPTLNEAGNQMLLGEILLTAAKLASEQGIDKTGYKVHVNVGEGEGQEILHLHFHLLGGWKGE